jgi:alkylated DNA repair dioxygenase AlkB
MKRKTTSPSAEVEEHLGDLPVSCLGGDPQSFYRPNFVPDPSATFDALFAEVENLMVRPAFRGQKMRREKVAFCDFFYSQTSRDYFMPSYKYPSSKQVKEMSWTPTASSLRQLAEEAGYASNHGIVTYYGSGSTGIGPHQDKDDTFLPGAPIVTLSFGATRILELVRISDGKVVQLHVQPGSLYVLSNKFNKEWTHAVPEAGKLTPPRISLVLRNLRLARAPDDSLVRLPYRGGISEPFLLREEEGEGEETKCELCRTVLSGTDEDLRCGECDRPMCEAHLNTSCKPCEKNGETLCDPCGKRHRHPKN